ncbi:hypothetical protein Tco_0679964 [Tanacetum coccineum]|uniref:Retrovirus-related Pol polyprotein from transposon TNT 1-94-like beta-barrel domain-containing protein n=1 Tax=Tanacetum coccineum TaxID=301880 RepID=A0ABQ4XJA0_9ASTR
MHSKSHITSRRPFNQLIALKNRILNNKVNTAKVNSINTAKGKRVTSAVGKQGINAVKSLACWVWRPKIKELDHVSKNSGSYICKQFDYVDPTSRLKHMTGNKSYLTDYQDYNKEFVAFGSSSKGGKITRKGKIRTGKLDFEDLYFVKELKFNLFSVSQMCDRKNNVLFTETECLILSPDFNLPDESQVMLKIPKKDNMYSFDLKNIVPSKVILWNAEERDVVPPGYSYECSCLVFDWPTSELDYLTSTCTSLDFPRHFISFGIYFKTLSEAF